MATAVYNKQFINFRDASNDTIARLDAAANRLTFAGVGGAGVNLGGLAAPVNDTDVANKSYVDNVAQGMFWLENVRGLYSAAANPSADPAPILVAGFVEDGVTYAEGDRVLVIANGQYNGIYSVGPAGGSASRTSDFAVGDEVSGKAIFVREGTSRGDTAWAVSSDNAVVGSTTAGEEVYFIQFSHLGNVTAGAGLSKTGSKQIDVNVDGTTIAIANDALQVADAGVGTTQLASDSVSTAKIQDGAVTTAKIADTNVTTAKLAGSSVTTAKIADDAVTRAKIGASAVGTTELGNSSVSINKMQANSVATTQLVNTAVTTAKLADDAVTTVKILDANVTTAKLADGAVTNVKLGNDITVLDINAGAGIDDNATTTGPIALGDAITIAAKVDSSTMDVDLNSALKVADGGVGTTQLADDSVTNAKIAAGAVDSTEIAARAVNNGHIGFDQIDNSHIADGTLNKAKLVENVITGLNAGDGLSGGGVPTLNDPNAPVLNIAFSVDSTVMRTTGGQTISGDLTLTGDVTATDFVSTSDERLKTHEPVKDWEKIKDVNVVDYRFKDGRDSFEHCGVLAQEVKEIYPEAVRMDENGYYSVNYQYLFCKLLKFVQEKC